MDRQMYDVIVDRRANPQEGSYTNYLFDKGLDKILKKVGEECAETIIAAKNAANGGSKDELVGEICDLMYHLQVMMVECDVDFEAVEKENDIRSQKIGNLKKMKVVDRNT